MIISSRVRARLEIVGLSQSELARRVGMTQGAIAKIANDDPNGSSKIHKIARHLATTVEYLEGETDDPDLGALPPPPPPPPRIWMEIQLPSEDALAEMFEGLLMGIDQAKPLGEQARLLAQSLPIGLSQLRDLRPPRPSAAPASARDPEQLATLGRGPGR